MEIKRAVSIYFSPTDGTRRVVRAVSQGLNAPDSWSWTAPPLRAAGPARSSGRGMWPSSAYPSTTAGCPG